VAAVLDGGPALPYRSASCSPPRDSTAPSPRPP